MSIRVRLAVRALGVLAGIAVPASADFNDLLQVICDEDNVITSGCDVTHDGLRFVHTVAVSPDDEHVYFCSSQADPGSDPSPRKESLSAYSRAMDGTLTLIDQEIEDSGGVSTLASCRGVAVSPDGKHVYTAALSDSAVTWFARNTTMASGDFGKLTFTAGDSISAGGPGGKLGGASAVVVSPDDEHVYVTGRSADSLVAFSRDATSGDLTEIADYFDGLGGVDGLLTPVDLAISPDGKHLYVASVGDDAVAVFSRDTDSMSATFGELTFVEARFDGAGGVNGLEDASRVTLDASGDNVYVSTEVSAATKDWFAVFARDDTTGELTFLQSFQNDVLTVPINCGGVGPSDSGIAVSPDGLFVAVASPFDAAIATFSRADDGTLSFVEAICDDILVDDDDIGSVVDLAISADGTSLYTAGGPFSILGTVDYECGSAEVDQVLTMDSITTAESEGGCRSTVIGPGYHVLPAGSLEVVSPAIKFTDGGTSVSFEGDSSFVLGVP